MTAANVLATPPRFPRFLLPANPPADPLDLDAAVAAGAFSALRTAVTELKADGVIAALSESGMRGRGGRGVPIGDKWRACARTAADRHYVVINAYQSDPAVITDRVLIERNPYAVIEGAAIGAFAVGATEVIVALRVEATDTIKAVETAIAAAEAAAFIGENVLGTGLEIRFSVRPLQGNYMLGEETVLLKGLRASAASPNSSRRTPRPAASSARRR